ncbi:C4-dicarboxylate ABC transporter [Phaeobacter gallaeciensis]|uniref:C4-dicarboxylate ABC transporter n=3 Tax=Rhodobacterales TaxID=204455 RepID=A0A366WSB7_9RHOB|nr:MULTISPECIES: TRAP transporter permease [Roseobacteraceae]MBT3140977.1 TRAP transporter permease [Falsiruegeria litorea]MBT8168132.1 TRAP transporter permease [Falsiruegeria litorea]RBW52915.1 C4-dicarboxylate ABC transporter [Phaeobacter gallaeciensis]
MSSKENAAVDDTDLEDILADADTGGRNPHDAFSRKALWYIPLTWSLFQLWIASPLPFLLRFGVLNDTQTRAIHLGFAVFLAFVAFPAFAKSPRDRIPLLTWATAAVGAAAASYLWYAYVGVANRTGAPNTVDLVVAGIGIVTLMEAARRSLGFPLMGVAMFFLAYVFFGSSEILPDVVRWKGASFQKAMSHMWLTTEGVFGVALGVSSGFVFLFVLFGALLNQAGAGNYFLKLAFATLGHLRGGPAKAAVIASAATGLISGSSIANVVTTGTFTIPLMKKVGFSPAKAGAIEVSSSINGVLTPPVMGAVAFLMTEYVGISYVEVVKTAIIPAAISYMALVYIVHLEALKMGMTGTSRMNPIKFMLGAIFIIASCIVIAGGTLFLTGYLVDIVQGMLGGAATPVLVAGLMAVYVLAVRFAASGPDLEMSSDSMEHLPPTKEIFKTGVHYLLPILLLMYLLMVERKSPALSAFWSTAFMLLILLTQNALKDFFRKKQSVMVGLSDGLKEIGEGLVIGARNMIGLAAAMGVAGIIVGAVTLTGVGQVMAEFVEFLSGGNLLAMLFFVAVISIVLGMGLPTTANYIVVSSLMAGVVVELGAQSGLIVPLVAVHMFCFYFGIMADVTPPVGLASFAAAAISKGDPLKTGFQAFFYSIRTALLPFLFIFNTDLLLIDVGPIQAVFVFIVALIAMLLFAAGTMGYFMTRSRLWESVALVLVAFTLFRPGFFLNQIAPEFEAMPATSIYQMAEQSADDTSLRVRLMGEDLNGKAVDAKYLLPLGPMGEDGAGRLLNGAGIELREEDGKFFIDNLEFGGAAEQLGIDFDWEIVELDIKAERIRKEVFYIPAFLLLGFVYLIQMRRKRRTEESVA